ncbi:MAG: T9SS type A sorting domain-containing protein [Bacteroidota bacterium]
MKLKFIITVIFLMNFVFSFGQNHFRNGIFLHHSTGGCIWGPNGSNTSVPVEMDEYNILHGYTGLDAVTLNEEWWSPGDNEWATQHAFFEDPDPVTGIGYYLPGNKIMVIKTCFPASAMSEAGHLSDTLTPEMKTVCNYKWHWRHIVNVMRQYPENFFVIWTNAPLEPNSTNLSEAALSDWFCTWAKDTLAQGLDPITGPFPSNIYVFDFFHKLTGANGMMLPLYAAGPGDSHPNALATALIAPQFVSEIFNSSIAYESATGISVPVNNMGISLMASPNPFSRGTSITLTIKNDVAIELLLLDVTGKRVKTLVEGRLKKQKYLFALSAAELHDGIYLLMVRSGNELVRLKLMVLR